jgi:hypothetical protein
MKQNQLYILVGVLIAVRRRDQARRIRHLDRGELTPGEGLRTFCLFAPFRPCGPGGRTL